MTAPEDPFAQLRAPLLAAARRLADARRFSHALLVRQQLQRHEHSRPATRRALLAPCLCLAAAEAAGARQEQALASAAALLCVVLMAEVFRELNAEGSATGLGTAWGMPRALNAGDAFFTLAQQAILESGLPPRRRARSLSLLDGAARAVSETLASSLGDSAAQRALLPSALALGAAAAGAPETVLASLLIASSGSGGGLVGAEAKDLLTRLAPALDYVTRMTER